MAGKAIPLGPLPSLEFTDFALAAKRALGARCYEVEFVIE
jgi:hypothetical protein